MYGRERAGQVADCWTEVRGLKGREGLDDELTRKFIGKSLTAVNEFINNSRYLSHMGRVGHWDQALIDRLVLPTCGDLIVDENAEIDDNVARETLIDEIVNNL